MAFDILPHRAATTIRLEPVESRYAPLVLFRIVDDSLRARELCFCLCDAVHRLRRGRRGSVAVAVCASRSDRRVGRQSGDRLWRSSLPRRHEHNSLGPCDRHGCTCRYGHFHYRPTNAAAKWHARRPRLRSDRRLCGLRTRAFGGDIHDGSKFRPARPARSSTSATGRVRTKTFGRWFALPRNVGRGAFDC